jgi:prepilin-type N-terminal cleavage/methylation domain-containing protein
MLEGMNREHGFTLVELLVTITIMVILITLSVVNLRSSQATARDDKRKSDSESIAQYLEIYYKTGSDTMTGGEYPPTAYTANEAAIINTLRDIDPKILRAPNVASTDPISLANASSTSVPAANVSAYIYQPLQSDGALCTTPGDECRKFNLFYTLESAPTVVQKITSKNQ